MLKGALADDAACGAIGTVFDDNAARPRIRPAAAEVIEDETLPWPLPVEGGG